MESAVFMCSTTSCEHLCAEYCVMLPQHAESLPVENLMQGISSAWRPCGVLSPI